MTFWLFPAMWLIWLVYWVIAARGAKPDARREERASRLIVALPMLAAAVLLAAPPEPLRALTGQFMPLAAWPLWTGAVMTGIGFGFAIWARVHLGANWSATVTVKQGHELIQSGPYALVRHPIYTGLLTAMIGTVIALGEWRGVAAVLIVLWALGRKLALEERWMREVFGEVYDDYAARVPALVPFAKAL